MSKIIGIIGGIASGKSTVAQFLKGLGANVLDADLENAALLLEPDYIAKVSALAPSCVHDGAIDKDALRSWMLRSDANYTALIQLAHPILRERITAQTQGNGLYFIELSAYYPDFMPLDEVWMVVAPPEVCIRRVMQRNGWPREQVERIIKRQTKMLNNVEPDVVLQNSEGMAELFKLAEAAFYKALVRYIQ